MKRTGNSPMVAASQGQPRPCRIFLSILALFITLAILALPAAASFWTVWQENAGNPVFDPAVRAYYPTVIYDSSAFSAHGPSAYYKMWFARGDGIAAAVSDDGIHWSEINSSAILTGLAAAANHPVVLYDAAGFSQPGNYCYRIWYWDSNILDTIGAIRTAVSTDGISWENDQPLQQHASDQSLQLVAGYGVYGNYFYHCYGPGCLLYNPSATNIGDATADDRSDDQPMTWSYVMYFDSSSEGFSPNGSQEQTSLAYSTDGIYWIRHGDQPVLLPTGNTADWDGLYAFRANVQQIDGAWHMWYSGANGDSHIGTPYAHGIGHASSSDGLDWTRDPDNPVLYVTDGVPWRSVRTYTPAVLYSSERFAGHGESCLLKMFFSGRDSENYAIGYAAICPVVPTITITSPNGGESWLVGSSHDIIWESTGTIGNVNIDVSYNGGSDWTPVVTSTDNDGIFNWTVAAVPSTTCLVRVYEAADSDPTDSSDALFSIIAAETVSAPTTPTGLASGTVGTNYTYSSNGSTSSYGHDVQYFFDWDDGSDSGWLAVGTTQASHSWATAGTYQVQAMARCASHTVIISSWSTALSVTISPAVGGFYNSPTQKQILPEVIWAPATGGGTWVSQVQVIDVSGGSQVQVYYNCASGRRGPFLLWDNSAGGAMSSTTYANLLQTIDSLDSGTFTYYGTVGAAEFTTQDAGHRIHVAARESNGNYAKTFPGLNLVNEETAIVGRNMIIPNLASNATNRVTCGFYNPTADALTMDLKLFSAGGTQAGSTFSRTLAGHGFMSFDPFTQSGVPYPGSAYDDSVLEVTPTSGSGSVMCFGATANNASNDPAAHIAVQESSYDNGSANYKILPEVIWAPATGGGTWVSDVQIIDVSGGSQVQVYYNCASGRRGPFLLWDNSAGGAMSTTTYANLLQTIDSLDSGTFTYYGTVGAAEFATQDAGHRIHVAARELNGNCAKTFPGLNLVNAETATLGRNMIIPNLDSNVTYRTTCGFYNPSADSLTMDLKLFSASGAQAGSTISRTLAGHEFMSFDPFLQAGVPYPGSTFDSIILLVTPTSGAGGVMCFGATANNFSNDPAAHIAVQGQ